MSALAKIQSCSHDPKNALLGAPLHGETMLTPIRLETSRLYLRQWIHEDKAPFAELNADARVMRYFPAPLTRAESDRMADKCQALIEQRGWGFWATELETGEFIGFVGLHVPVAELPFSPCVEIGWRLAFDHWHKGLATEAAKAALAFGFNKLALDEIVAFTAVDNQRFRAVMERLGMKDSGTFQHVQIPTGHALRLHRLYRLSRSQHDAQASLA